MVLSYAFSFAWVLSSFTIQFATAQETSPGECKRFQDIFVDGKDLCERMYGDAFEYIPTSKPFEHDLAYTMWFFSDRNPNDATTVKRILASKHDLAYTDTSVCHLKSLGVANHKDVPSAENESTLTECHPFQANACCNELSIKSGQRLNKAHRDGYIWDRCGPMSRECNAFFVQESCFYECDPNAGIFRKYPPTLHNSAEVLNEWELYKLPIKGDYCDAWFNACRRDMFCGSGNIFECERMYVQDPGDQEIPPTQGKNSGLNETSSTASVVERLSGGAIFGILLPSLLFILTLTFSCYLIRRERQGIPVFTRGFSPDDTRPIEPRSSSLQSLNPQQQPHQNSNQSAPIAKYSSGDIYVI
jgi:folate receptor